MTGTQAATALQRATWSKGVNIDKSRLYRSEPTEIKGNSPEIETTINILVNKFGHVLPEPLRTTLKGIDQMNQEAEAIEATASEGDC